MLKILLSIQLLVLTGISNSNATEDTFILGTIRPIELIISDLVDDQISHKALLKQHQNPHNLHLQYSQRVELENADMVFWFGERLETSLSSLFNDDQQVANKTWRLDIEQEEEHDHLHADQHHENAHFWLDRDAVIDAAKVISDAIGKKHPRLAQQLTIANQQLVGNLRALELELRDELQIIQNKRVLDLHNAWAPFAEDFELKNYETASHQQLEFMGAKSVVKLQQRIRQGSFDCVLIGPDSNLRLANNLVGDNPQTRLLLLDPLGNDLGPEAEFIDLIRNAILSMANC